MEIAKPVNRRTVLQRGIGFLAGVVGLQVLEDRAMAQTGPPAPPNPPTGSANPRVMRFYARSWQVHAHGHVPGQMPGSHERMNRQGDLLDPATQKKAGDFSSSCFCTAASFGAASNGSGLELHTLHVGEDTLFGMGSSSTGSGACQVHAIVGGTGEFAGARGSFLVTPKPVSQVGSEVEIVLTIIT